MTPEVNKLWKGAKKNKQFKKDMWKADRDFIHLFMHNTLKTLWATSYYGWLIGKYGIKDWEKHINA